MAIKICIYSPKGGIGKTSITMAISGNLAKNGFRVLVIDADPLTTATKGLRHDKKPEVEYAKLIMDYCYDGSLQDPRVAIVSTSTNNLDLMPSTQGLDKAIKQLASGESEDTMKFLFADLEDDYDFIFIDPKADRNSALSLNSLVYVDAVIIPITSDKASIQAYFQAMDTLATLKRGAGTFSNKDIQILGVILNMYSNKRKDDNDILAILHKEIKGPEIIDIIGTPIREVKATVQNAAKEGIPICDYQPLSAIAAEYNIITDEIVRMTGGK